MQKRCGRQCDMCLVLQARYQQSKRQPKRQRQFRLQEQSREGRSLQSANFSSLRNLFNHLFKENSSFSESEEIFRSSAIYLIIFFFLFNRLDTCGQYCSSFLRTKSILLLHKYNYSLIQEFLYHENLQPHHGNILFWFLEIFYCRWVCYEILSSYYL